MSPHGAADATPGAASSVPTDAPGVAPHDLARFFAKVQRFGLAGCWQWTGATQSGGYGRIKWGGKVALAHRVSWEIHRGPVPDGMQLDHLCRNTRCVNPHHLEPVPQRTNTLRGTGPTAVNAAKTHCDRGHEFTPENTSQRKDRPGRICLACKRLQNAARPPRVRAA